MSSTSRRASIWEWTQTALLVANLAWTTLCLGGYRPETKVITYVLTSALLVVNFASRGLTYESGRGTHAAGWALLPFLVYAAVNVMAVSPVPWLGWMDWLGWANLAAVFWIVLNGIEAKLPRRAIFLMLIVLGIAGVILGCYQRFVRPGWLMLGRQQVDQFLDRASGPFGIPNSLGAFLLLLLPAAGALTFRRQANAIERVWWGWVTLVFAIGLLLTVSRGAWIALAIALIAWPLSARRWRWKHRVTLATIVVGALVTVGAIVYQSAPKIRERFEQMQRDAGELSRPYLWRAGWNMFGERPFFGTGAGSYNVLFERYRPERFVDEPQWAHNDYLNTLSDYGAVGFALLFGVAGMIVVRRWLERAPHQRDGGWLESSAAAAGLAIGLLAFALQLFVDFHFKIPALAMAFAVVAALAMGQRSASSLAEPLVPRSRVFRFTWALAATVVLLAMVPLWRFQRGEALRYRARQSLDTFPSRRSENLSEMLQKAETDLRQATAFAPRNANAWSDLAYALELQAVAVPARVGELAGPATEAAERAVAFSNRVPEFWMRLGVARDMQAHRREAQQAFEKAVSLAPRNSHAWYYYAHHLSIDTDQREAALRAIAKCLSLDPGNRAAEALEVKLNARSSGARIVP